jgi:signal transduction histidine kinase
MKIRTKIIIACILSIVMPLIFMVLAFLGIGRFLGAITPEMRFTFDQLTKHWLIDLSIAGVVILIATGLLISGWLHRGIYEPVSKLNEAMGKIREGDYSYVLETDAENEFGDLYRSYEDMRMQLKENCEERARQELKNRELISNISHDLKTPITAIKGYAEGIMDGVATTPEKTEKYVRTIYNKAIDMDRLINELTTYSNVDNDRIPYKFLRINIADYFHDCVEEIGLDLEQRGIEFNYSNMVNPDTQVIADPEQLKKVINNIISNSIKYIDKPKGIISLRLLDQNDSVMVEIEDNGRGIAQQDLPKIFERFYRTDASRNSAQGGSGIGLSIVKKIIEDHGGYIWATSKEGESTCMHFVLRKYIEL